MFRGSSLMLFKATGRWWLKKRELPKLLSLCMKKNKIKKAQKLIYFGGIHWLSSG